MKKSMRTARFGWFAIVLALVGLSACTLDKDSDNIMYPSAIVTVKPDADGSTFRMQLDDKTELHAVNMKASPFGSKEVRALVNYRKPTSEEMQKGGLWDDANNVYVNWIDSILTKTPVPDLGEMNAETYGDDPVEIYGDWATNVEDGYLTLHFTTYWMSGVMHTINLVTGSDPDDPYKVVLYHDAGGNRYGEAGDALVAFSLASLPDTGDKTVDLTFEWTSFSGKKTYKFPYRTR